MSETMTKRSVTHATFTIERTYDAPPALVFHAFADGKAKATWFGAPGWSHELDFRVGGHERASGSFDGKVVHTYHAIYQDIVPDERIIAAYDMHLDDKRISVSLMTVELKPAGAGTRLVFTEQGAFLDGFDRPEERERGTRELLDALGAALEKGAIAD